MLLPFVRLVIGCLLVLCVAAAAVDIARVHMIILSVLGGGLLLSLQFFESEFRKAQQRQRGGGGGTAAATASSSSSGAKTD